MHTIEDSPLHLHGSSAYCVVSSFMAYGHLFTDCILLIVFVVLSDVVAQYKF